MVTAKNPNSNPHGRLRQPSRKRARLNAVNLALLAGTIAASLVAAFTLAAPGVKAGASNGHAEDQPSSTHLSRKFKGKLPITELTEDQAIEHALNRLGYGPRPGDIERVRRMGLQKWIDRQLRPESIEDSALDQRLEKYPTLSMSSKQLLEQFPPPNQAAKQADETRQEYKDQLKDKRRAAMAQAMDANNGNMDRAEEQLARLQGPNRIVAELSMAKIDRAVHSERQLEAVMEDFWFNHFNVYAAKGDDRWLLTSYVRDTIRPHALGKFQDLLIATAKSPAMLFYLDNWLSVDPAAFQAHQAEVAARRARFGGIFAGGNFPQPGAFPAPGAGGAQAAARKQQDRGLNENYGREVMELHTVGVDADYTQQDVIEMAKCLTGWSIRQPRRDPDFLFREDFHAQGKKVVMGHTFNYGDERDGEEALKMLANDPHTARSISTELARHFVSDTPPRALVERMTKTYESSGGDIRKVLQTMIYSPEFWSQEAYRAKIKTPFELVASTARALDADTSISLPLVNWVGRMGEPLFMCQTPNGYSDKARTWVNTGALLNRLNFALAFSADRMPGSSVDLSKMFGEDAARDPQMALQRSLDLFLDGQVDPQTRQTLEARLQDPQILQARLDDPVKQVNEGLLAGLVLGTPEFQRR